MSTWSEVRRLAVARHNELAGQTDTLVPADALLALAEKSTGVKRMPRPAGDSLLEGGEATYDRDLMRIYYSIALELALAHFYIAHEYGHHWLGEAEAKCEHADFDMETPAEPVMSLVGDADAYSPKERTEALANVFAREFLLPRAKLHQRLQSGSVHAEALAVELGLPVDLVLQQLTDAVLLPEQPAEEKEDCPEAHEPDASQKKAIEAPDGPRQVRAGPGTGKTRTLVGRVAHLIKRGEEAGSILALTYSNLSAQDLSARIRAAVGPTATAVWAGTFHAFGLELLRKYGDRIGFAAPPKLLDRTDSLMLLEQLLEKLDLRYYLDPHEPARALQSILRAISRAKDELVTPAAYEALAQKMRAAAGVDAEATEAAEKAIEVARVYGIYERTLRERGLVDFGDLVKLPVELLRAHADVKSAVRSERRHILVDEYQDMNRASGMFLKEIVTPGKGPWVVGDVRQAVYRFRGASPLNMSRFSEDFPGAEFTDLSTNYRSDGKIVRVFEAFGKDMTAARLAAKDPLVPSRGKDAGEVSYDIAATREAEGHGIATAILAREKKGVRFSHQVVLARTHTMLTRLAAELERAGVPCLYFGNFFERPEVRDLLALLSLVSEKKGVGLLHAAQMPHYAVPPADIAAVVKWRTDNDTSMLKALGRLGEIGGLSVPGSAALNRLAQDVAHTNWPLSPHSFLVRYLFGSSEHVRTMLTGDTVAAQQKRLAVYQLLQFAFAFKPPEKVDPKRAFLDHIRRLEALDEEKQLRQLPAAARNIEAVKLMTIHASKGLEFPVVYIPCLAKTLFPANNQHEPCPAPEGMVAADNLMTHDAEEDSLYFVGMSRAQNVLHLSRSVTNGKVNRGPSRFLERVSSLLPRPLEAAPNWTTKGPESPPYPRLSAAAPQGEWSTYAIETYIECPRKYYYEFVLTLGGSEDGGPYLKFQSALHATVAWLRTKATTAERTNGVTAQFDGDWEKWGPVGHAFETFYRKLAVDMVARIITLMDGESLPAERTLKLPETGAVVRFRADQVQKATDGAVVVQRLKASRLAKTEKDKPKHTLWQVAIAQDHKGTEVRFEHVSLLTGERRASSVNAAKLSKSLTLIEDAVRGVTCGDFDPNRNDYCPTCPYYFICPSPGATV